MDAAVGAHLLLAGSEGDADESAGATGGKFCDAKERVHGVCSMLETLPA
jgi:hypothetical protein